MKKVLAIILSMAVITALFAVMLASAVPAPINISSYSDLKNWLDDQKDNSVLVIKNDIAVIPNDTLAVSGQTGWFIPITANNVTIMGDSGLSVPPVIYGDKFVASGGWATQTLIAVFGNDCTIKDLTIMPKVEGNKTIEVLGRNFTLTNCTITPNNKTSDYGSMTSDDIAWDKTYGGAVYFNGESNPDLGQILIDGNDLVNTVVSFDGVESGTLIDIQNNTLNFDVEGMSMFSTVKWGAVDTSATIYIHDNNIESLGANSNFISQKTLGDIILSDNTFADGFSFDGKIIFNDSVNPMNTLGKIIIAHNGVVSKYDPSVSATTPAIVDKTALKDAIDFVFDDADFTEGSVSAYNTVLLSAIYVYHNIDASQTEVDAMLANLTDAQDALVGITELKEAIADANALDQDLYTSSSVLAYMNALSSAKDVFANPDATKDEIANAINALNTAKNNLEHVKIPVDKAKLKSTIDFTFNKDLYTAESLANYYNALANAERVYGDYDATAYDVQEALNRLNDAIYSLDPIKDKETSTNPPTGEF